MARFEHSTLWDTNHTRDIEGMRINGALYVPEFTLAPPPLPRTTAHSRSPPPAGYFQYAIPEVTSPTESIDSAFVSRPTSCNPSSHKHLLYGAPNLSVAILDTTTGNNERLSIPAPKVTDREEANSDNFSQGEVLTMAMVGESQVWAGTANGSLHVFDLEFTPDFRFSKHVYTTLMDPVLHVATRQLPERPSATATERVGGRGGQGTKMDILLGSPSGYVTVISGELDERGGLRNTLRCLRKVVRIGDDSQAVHCITHVACAGIETYWCGCGSEIAILCRSTWKVHARQLHTTIPQRLPRSGRARIVTQLLSSEQGVWSCLSNSSTVTLWDMRDFTSKMEIPCFSSSPRNGLLDHAVQTTALAFSYPLLFVGTSGGHLMAFRTVEELPVRQQQRRGSIPSAFISSSATSSLPILSQNAGSRPRNSPGYKFLGATHCGPYSIVSIYAAPPAGRMDPRRSPLWSPVNSPGSSAVVVVAVCGPRSGGGEGARKEKISMSQVQIYELVSTPVHSPADSPESSISPGYSSISPSYISSRRNRTTSNSSSSSLSGHRHSLPAISVAWAAPTSLIFLPLENKADQ